MTLLNPAACAPGQWKGLGIAPGAPHSERGQRVALTQLSRTPSLKVRVCHVRSQPHALPSARINATCFIINVPTSSKCSWSQTPSNLPPSDPRPWPGEQTATRPQHKSAIERLVETLPHSSMDQGSILTSGCCLRGVCTLISHSKLTTV